MKTLPIGLLILVMLSGQLNADENAIPNKITLNLDSTSEVSVEGLKFSHFFTLCNLFAQNWVFNYKGVNLKSPSMFIIHDKSN